MPWKRQTGSRTHSVQVQEKEDEVSEDLLIGKIDDISRTMKVELWVNDVLLAMEVDTGAAVSIISEKCTINCSHSPSYSLRR